MAAKLRQALGGGKTNAKKNEASENRTGETTPSTSTSVESQDLDTAEGPIGSVDRSSSVGVRGIAAEGQDGTQESGGFDGKGGAAVSTSTGTAVTPTEAVIGSSTVGVSVNGKKEGDPLINRSLETVTGSVPGDGETAPPTEGDSPSRDETLTLKRAMGFGRGVAVVPPSNSNTETSKNNIGEGSEGNSQSDERTRNFGRGVSIPSDSAVKNEEVEGNGDEKNSDDDVRLRGFGRGIAFPAGTGSER